MSQLIKTYENEELIVYWKPNKCIHAGKCVHGAPTVFDVDANPWININGSSTEHIKDVIDRCPSGALSYKEKE